MDNYMAKQIWYIWQYCIHQENLLGEHISFNRAFKMWSDHGYAKTYADKHQ